MASAKPGVHILTLDEVKVDPRLIEGEKFIKWTDGESTCPVTLHVDSRGFFLYWHDTHTKEVKYLDISQVRDVRTGPSAKMPKDQKVREIMSVGKEDTSITIVYGTDFVNTNYHNFWSKERETAKLWHSQLQMIITNALAANISSLCALEKVCTQIKLLATPENKVPVKSLAKLFSGSKDGRRQVEKALEISGMPGYRRSSGEVDKDSFTFPKFFEFYRNFVQRNEVLKIFETHCKSDPKKCFLSIEEFVDFVNSQRDPRLNEILFPYCNREKANELIGKFELNPENAKKKRLSMDGFLRYLLSDENQVVSADLFDLHDDMNLPLSHYFIQSSHNTYLTGHQWTGKSSVEMYRQVLLAGCRCIELDLWDGKKDEEPIIVHGYTLVPEIQARDVIEAIAECAFKTSDYPLILSFENHCKPKQQAKIAQYCREYFGSMLLTEPFEESPLKSGVPLPSPEALKRKILIKNKKKHIKEQKCAPDGIPLMPPQLEGTAAFVGDAGMAIAAAAAGAGAAAAAAAGTGPGISNRTDLNGDESSSRGLPDAATVDDSGESDSDDDEMPPNKELSGVFNALPDERGSAANARKKEKESKAGEEISALVNYVQAVRFHGFDHAERRNRSYEMSSFEESTAVSWLKESPFEFVKYNIRQISRIFPRGTRLDSSNFMPQVFWNAGCQLVALNYQNLDLPMQLNLGTFEFNRKCGYLRKPSFMCREDRMFDPFTDTPVDGIVPGTVSIQILSGQFLTDRHVGTYVEVDMFGLPCDTVRRKFKTKVVPNNGISPIFSEAPFVFKQVVLPDLAVIRIAVYEESGKMIGHRVLPVKGIRPGYRHISLRNESGQFLTFPTLFVHVVVQDYVPDRFSDFAEALANPIRYQTEKEKRAQQLKVLTEDTEEDGGDLEPESDNGVAGGDDAHQDDVSGGGGKSAVLNSTPSPSRNHNPSSLSPVKAANALSSASEHQSESLSALGLSGGVTAALPRLSKKLSLKRASSTGAADCGGHGGTFLTSSPKAGGGGSSAAPLAASSATTTSASAYAEVTETSLESLLENKAIKEKMMERDKKLKSIAKKYDKEVEKLRESLQAKEEKTLKGSTKPKYGKTKLVKILSDRTGTPEASSNGSESSLGGDSEEKLRRLRAVYQERISTVEQEKEKAEAELKKKYKDIVITTAEKQMKLVEQNQVKLLGVLHERECAEMLKRIEAQAADQIKQSTDKDKEEKLRLKKEKRSFIVKRGLEERRKLNDIHQKKLRDLEKNHAAIKEALIKEMAVESSLTSAASSTSSSLTASKM